MILILYRFDLGIKQTKLVYWSICYQNVTCRPNIDHIITQRAHDPVSLRLKGGPKKKSERILIIIINVFLVFLFVERICRCVSSLSSVHFLSVWVVWTWEIVAHLATKMMTSFLNPVFPSRLQVKK